MEPTDPASQAKPDHDRIDALEDDIPDADEAARGDAQGADGPKHRFIDPGTEGEEYDDNAIAPG